MMLLAAFRNFRSVFIAMLAAMVIGSAAYGQGEQPHAARGGAVICGDTTIVSASDEAYCRKFRLVQELKKDEAWYEFQSNALNNIWIGGSILVILLTSVTSLLVALGLGSEGSGRIVVSCISATAGILAAIMTQFQVRDLWELREMGRIATQELIEEARGTTAADDVEMRTKLAPVRTKRIELSRAQASRFFASLSKTADIEQTKASSVPPKQDQ